MSTPATATHGLSAPAGELVFVHNGYGKLTILRCGPIPAGSTSGKVMRLKGKGFSRKGGGRGDQLVRLMVDLPQDDAELEKLVEAWTDGRAVRADLGV